MIKLPEHINNIACIYAGKDKDKAIRLLKQAIRLRPDYMDARQNLNEIEAGLENFRVTLRELRKVLTNYNTVPYQKHSASIRGDETGKDKK